MFLHLDIFKDFFFLSYGGFTCQHFINTFYMGALTYAPSSSVAHTTLVCRLVCASCVQDMIKVKFHVPFWTFNLGILKTIHHYHMLGCKCQIIEASLARAYSCQLKTTSAILNLPQMFNWLNNENEKAYIFRQKRFWFSENTVNVWHFKCNLSFWSSLDDFHLVLYFLYIQFFRVELYYKSFVW